MAFYFTLLLTSWLVISARAPFAPGCSFSNGQCLYNVQLGHEGQCDTVTSGTSNSEVCCDAIQGQVSTLITDVSTLKSQVSTLMSELSSSKSNLSSLSSQLTEAQDRTQQLLLTLAQKEAELNSTQAELSKVIGQAGEEIRRLTSELSACKGALGVATNSTTSTTTLPDTSILPQRVRLSFCDFEEKDICGFTSDPGNLIFGFIRDSGPQNDYTGPIGDHTLGSPKGHYMLLDTEKIARNTTLRGPNRVSLISPEYPPGPGYCIRVWYNMHGVNVLDFDVYVQINSNTGYPVIHRSGGQAQEWSMAEADLDSEYTSYPFRIVISATTDAHNEYYYHELKNYRGDIAFDDVFVYNTRCSNLPLCPSNSVTWSNGGQTYCYTFHTQPTTWYQAASLCRQEGAKSSLVTVTSQAEQDFLVHTIKASAVLSIAGQAGFYTAGNDERSEHTFDWTDTGTPYQGLYSNWKAGQPNNVAGDQDCLLLQYPELNYQWGDVDCDEVHPFICKTVHPDTQLSSSTIIG